jgi:hypothetical protein
LDKKTNILFISNEKFLSNSFAEGGVKFCTDEFLALLHTGFEVIKFPVKYTTGLGFRIKKKLGISAYDDYAPEQYLPALKEMVIRNGVEYIFLNLTNTATFAKPIKEILPGVKVILCSHGNESGDHLHEVATHQSFSGAKKKTATKVLGRMLVKEAEQRKYIDLVLTVSDVEEGIEKWLGAKQVYMVPRHIDQVKQDYKPILGRVGFFSDLSHRPNYYGISEVCKAIEAAGYKDLTIRLAGGGAERGKELEQKYSFVQYLSYLPEEELIKETSSWTFALNPVFYYSRGVSTKLGKSLGMGLPVITTQKGLRGYEWKEGELPVANDAEEMAMMIDKFSRDPAACEHYKNEVYKIQQSSPAYEQMMSEIKKLL